MVMLPLDCEQLRHDFNAAQPFRFIQLNPFLDDAFAREVADAYPTFEESRKSGTEFSAVNERRKVQVTDSEVFPDPVKRLHEELCSPAFLKSLEYITGIPSLNTDPGLAGGGMHLTGPGGRLDVHVDFNYNEHIEQHRRLNILVYLNPVWEQSWGGNIELWDADVKKCHHSYLPSFNRCLIFETHDASYHGVQPVLCPPEALRRSFAAYYYTEAAPPHWNGQAWSTVFRARPSEKLRGNVLMPLEQMERKLRGTLHAAKRKAKSLLG